MFSKSASGLAGDIRDIRKRRAVDREAEAATRRAQRRFDGVRRPGAPGYKSDVS